MERFMPGGCVRKFPEDECNCTPHGLTLDEYQTGALTTDTTPEHGFDYFVLGVAGEAGELAEQVKKYHRDDDGQLLMERRQAMIKELGDVMWYIAVMAHRLDLSLEEVALLNLEKLADRAARGKIKGSGDDR
jgi:NTP pyrophosphatase (non-canonical NTP hydrolase)